jgi:hypothetical protein
MYRILRIYSIYILRYGSLGLHQLTFCFSALHSLSFCTLKGIGCRDYPRSPADSLYISRFKSSIKLSSLSSIPPNDHSWKSLIQLSRSFPTIYVWKYNVCIAWWSPYIYCKIPRGLMGAADRICWNPISEPKRQICHPSAQCCASHER